MYPRCGSKFKTAKRIYIFANSWKQRCVPKVAHGAQGADMTKNNCETNKWVSVGNVAKTIGPMGEGQMPPSTRMASGAATPKYD